MSLYHMARPATVISNSGSAASGSAGSNNPSIASAAAAAENQHQGALGRAR